MTLMNVQSYAAGRWIAPDDTARDIESAITGQGIARAGTSDLMPRFGHQVRGVNAGATPTSTPPSLGRPGPYYFRVLLTAPPGHFKAGTESSRNTCPHIRRPQLPTLNATSLAACPMHKQKCARLREGGAMCQHLWIPHLC